MNDIVILGCGKFAREVYDWVNISNNRVIGFYSQYSDISELRGLPIWTKPELIPPNSKWVSGVGDPEINHILYNEVSSFGIKACNPIISNSIVGSNTKIGFGSIICPSSVITTDVEIGFGCIVNIGCTIGHDVKILDWSVLCPNSSISGNVNIGNKCFIGTLACINPGITIGDKTIIGSGSTLIKSEYDGYCVMVGSPAKVIKKINE